MLYQLDREYEHIQYRGQTYLRKLPEIEPTYTFEAGDFAWTAGDIEFSLKMGFYHWILYGDWKFEGKPLPASFVRFVRSKCSTPPLTNAVHGVE